MRNGQSGCACHMLCPSCFCECPTQLADFRFLHFCLLVSFLENVPSVTFVVIIVDKVGILVSACESVKERAIWEHSEYRCFLMFSVRLLVCEMAVFHV